MRLTALFVALPDEPAKHVPAKPIAADLVALLPKAKWFRRPVQRAASLRPLARGRRRFALLWGRSGHHGYDRPCAPRQSFVGARKRRQKPSAAPVARRHDGLAARAVFPKRSTGRADALASPSQLRTAIGNTRSNCRRPAQTSRSPGATVGPPAPDVRALRKSGVAAVDFSPNPRVFAANLRSRQSACQATFRRRQERKKPPRRRRPHRDKYRAATDWSRRGSFWRERFLPPCPCAMTRKLSALIADSYWSTLSLGTPML